jgi:voltage-gated potassium channel Kch
LLLGEKSEELSRKTGLATRLATRIGAASGLTANLAFVRTISRRWMPLGASVVIVGGELVGDELAEFLQERGRHVTVIEPAPRLGKGLPLVRRMRLLAELKEHNVALHGGVTDIAIKEKAVTFTDDKGIARSVAADHVIVAMGASGDMTLANSLRAEGFVVEAVGDCTGIGYIEGAIRSAAAAVKALTSSAV